MKMKELVVRWFGAGLSLLSASLTAGLLLGLAGFCLALEAGWRPDSLASFVSVNVGPFFLNVVLNIMFVWAVALAFGQLSIFGQTRRAIIVGGSALGALVLLYRTVRVLGGDHVSHPPLSFAFWISFACLAILAAIRWLRGNELRESGLKAFVFRLKERGAVPLVSAIITAISLRLISGALDLGPTLKDVLSGLAIPTVVFFAFRIRAIPRSLPAQTATLLFLLLPSPLAAQNLEPGCEAANAEGCRALAFSKFAARDNEAA